MKILILTSNYPRENALNNGIFIHQQVKALQELGAECHVLLLYNWYPPWGLHKLHPMWRKGHWQKQILFEEYEGVRIHRVPSFIRMPARFFPENTYDRAVRSLYNYITGIKQLRDADWIYAQFLTDNGYIGAKLKDKLGIKLAAIARGDDVHAWPQSDPALADNIRYVFEHADLLLANNKRLAKDALVYAGKVVPQFKIAYNGVAYQDFVKPATDDETNTKLRQQYRIPDGKKVLLCIARAEYMKGWNELLEAFAACKETLNDWVLLAITDRLGGKYAIDIPAKIKELGIENRVVVHDFVPHTEVKKIYSIPASFILPSYNEGLSNAVLEAMSAGLWVITTDVGGHAEIIRNGESGFLIAPKSETAIMESLKYMAANYEQRKDEVSTQAVTAMQQLGDYKKNAAVLLGYMEGVK
ncbi:MAG: glycosyltransferase [Taibaiella sp.]|nr:glycosyltransferase [Taibaiella sp.]